MRKFLLFALLAAASASVVAQQQPQKQRPQEQPKESDSKLERTRVDGAAGGTRPAPPRQRKAVGAGAGPHLRHEQPSPSRLPDGEPVQPGR